MQTSLGITPVKTNRDSCQVYDDLTGLVSSTDLDTAESTIESDIATAGN